MKQSYKILGTFLRNSRQKADISQAKLGAILGYHPQFISNWERGMGGPPLRILRKLCHTLKIKEKDILRVILREQKMFIEKVLSSKDVG